MGNLLAGPRPQYGTTILDTRL